MKKTATLIFSLLAISCAAQNSDKYPFYSNSAVLEFASPWAYIHGVSGKTTYKSIKLPATFISGEFRIKNKLYLEGGLKYGVNFGSFYISNGENPFHYREFLGTCYAGGLLKLKIFRNFYFTPSLDFYYSRIKRFHSDTLFENSSYYTLGPTIGFEYFISKGISLNTDLLNVNFGLHSDSQNQPARAYSEFTINKMLSLGIHYNFDWKKQRSK